MTSHCKAISPPHPLRRPTDDRLLPRLLRAVCRWHARRAFAREVGRMDDRALADIGLSRDDVAEELRRPLSLW